MSLPHRKSFCFLVSLLAIGEAAQMNEECTEVERIWWRRIKDHIENSPDFPIDMDPSPKVRARLGQQAREIAETMVHGYSLMVLVNVWMAWCEDRLAMPLQPKKARFYEELLAMLDGLYALLDPDYSHKEEALTAVVEAKRLEAAIR